MSHPIFINSKSVLAYFGAWILISGIHAFVLFNAFEFPLYIAIAEGLSFNILFCFLGIALWYVIRYNVPEQKSQTSVWINLLTSMILIVLIWFALAYTILNILFAGITAYMEFLTDSLPFRLISGILIFTLIGMGYFLVIYYNNLQAKAKTEARLSEVLRETELNMLKSQINPHFLFNSLNSISALTITDPDKARDMVIKLSDFLRYTVSTTSSVMTTLEKELANIHRYHEIEKVRFGERLIYNFKLGPDCLQQMIPVMLLQPLFENAIKHGVYESTGNICIDLSCTLSNCCLEMTISNDFDPDAPSRKGSGLGLKNIRERLKLLFQNEKLIETKIIGNKFLVYLCIPVKEERVSNKLS
jgi:sensor histidine kinase YesM